tara:strand:+ start:383 stop:547 length:165 start_codon:yes stop_codon:yes gene_type:complete
MSTYKLTYQPLDPLKSPDPRFTFIHADDDEEAAYEADAYCKVFYYKLIDVEYII